MASISDFKSNLTGGGARANQFRVGLTFPSFVSGGAVLGNKSQFLCKAASLPGAYVEDIGVNYRGRLVHFAGERTFDPWAVSIYNDTNFAIRDAFERWSNGINAMKDNTGKVNPADYQVDLEVFQLGRNGEVIKSYKFIDAYPQEVSPIALDFDTNNVIEVFDVRFMYNYWTAPTTEGGVGVSVSINTPSGSFPI